MNNNSEAILGKRFTQIALKSNFQSVKFGQPAIFRLLLVTLVVLIAISTGCLLGFLGSTFAVTISRTILGFNQSVFLVLVVVSIISIWVAEIIFRGLGSSLWKTSSFILLMLVSSVLTFRTTELIGAILLLAIVALAVVSLSLVANGLSLSLISTLSNRRHFGTIYLILTISISTAVAYSYMGSTPRDTPYFPVLKILAGFLTSYCLLRASNAITKANQKLARDLQFLKSWSIALASWGGTSFYNLDLSEIDFSNSHLANCDFRARRLYRTCLKGVTGLERARVDNRYLDLNHPKVHELLTRGYSDEQDFSRTNLRGANLKSAQMQRLNLAEANLDGADLRGTDLRDAILLRSQVTGVNFSEANLTGVCIKDWSTNGETCFTNVQCDYVYREYEHDKPSDRYPVDRNFEPGEFENLFQKVKNAVELVFKDGVNLRALSFAFQNVELEDDGLDLQLKGIERRGDLWIVKVTHREGASRQEVEQHLMRSYGVLEEQLAAKDQQISQLMGITRSLAAASENYSKKPFGNSFVISGSTIANLAGSGKINYDEAASQVRQLVTHPGNDQPATAAENLLNHFASQQIATTPDTQTELVQQVLLAEAEKDWFFRQFLIQQGQEVIKAMPEGVISKAFQQAIEQLG